MSERQCWTCGTAHDLDEACAKSATARSTQAAGGSLLFKAEVTKYGAPFAASYDGEATCCGQDIESGDMIRADGEGGWIHANGECDQE